VTPPALRAAAVCCLLLMSLPAAGHLPAVYGRDYLLADQGQGAEPADCSPLEISSPRSGEPLQQRLAELEVEAGPYAAALAEPLADLGRYHRDRGDLDEAALAFHRALHLVRVNEGLNSTTQLALLEELAETFRRQGDLVALDQVQARKFRVRRQDPDADESATAQAALEYLSWQRQAFGSGLDGHDMQRLLEAYLLNRRLLDEWGTGGRTGEPRYRQLVFSQLANLYLIMGIDLLETGGTAIVMTGTVQPSQSTSESYVRQRIGRMQIRGLGDGKRLLQSLLDATSPEEALALASTRLALGDWLQWNGDYRAADVEYEAVVRLLQQQGELELLRSWLGEPRELPDARLFQPFDARDLQALSGNLTASFVVSGRGVASDLELQGEDSRDASRLRRMIAGTHFRPRYLTGKPEERRVELRQYRLVRELVTGAPGAGCIAGVM